MILIITVIVYILIFSLFIFNLFFSDADADGMLGSLSKLLNIRIPAAMRSFSDRYFGEDVSELVGKLYDYIVNKRNPLMQMLYLLIINAAYLVFIIYGQTRLPTIFMPSYHGYIAFIGVLICHISFYLACTVPPGAITDLTIHSLDHQPYDNLIYINNRICKTCNIRKLARSKHCSLCNACIAITDHHCIWINQCVGEHNYRYFLLFLFIHAIYLIYAAIGLYLIIISEVYENKLYDAIFYDHSSRREIKATTHIIFTYILSNRLHLCIIFMLASVMSIAISLFFCYHIYLLYIGETTNETYKWAGARKVYKFLLKRHLTYIARQEELKQKDEVENEGERSISAMDTSVNTGTTTTATVERTATTTIEQTDSITTSSAIRQATVPTTDPTTVNTSTATERSTNTNSTSSTADTSSEPIGQSNKSTINTYIDTSLASILHDPSSVYPHPAIHPGDPPHNPYKIGLRASLIRVIWPPSLYITKESSSTCSTESGAIVNKGEKNGKKIKKK